jgi:hypothetical protein
MANKSGVIVTYIALEGLWFYMVFHKIPTRKTHPSFWYKQLILSRVFYPSALFHTLISGVELQRRIVSSLFNNDGHS